MRKKRTTFNTHEVLDYEKKRYHGFDQKIVDWKERRVINSLFGERDKERARILDLPCGFGRFSGLLAQKSQWFISGDVSFSMVKRAVQRRIFLEMNGGIGVACDAAEGLPFEDEALEGVFCMRFFHHVHEKNQRIQILKEFFRVTSDWVMVSFYRLNILHRLQRKIRKMGGKSRTNINMISKKEFIQEAEKSGFRIKKITPLFRGVHSQHIALLKKVKPYFNSGFEGKAG